MADPSPHALELLADVAVACVGGHTRPSLARRVAQALAQRGPVRWLQLAWLAGDAGFVPGALRVEAVEVVATAGFEATTLEPALLGPRLLVAEALAARAPVLVGADGGLVETARARAAGADRVTALPLFDGGAPVGALLLGVAGKHDRWTSPALLKALAAVVLAGHRACRTIERVAQVSLRAHEQNRELRRRLDAVASGPSDLVARGPAMAQVLARADLVAEHDTTVLLRGETGTGKGLLARRIHAASPRSDGPFVHVDCTALPEALIESELFGHEPGAFTGATRRHVGRFERAGAGTVFLDEVAELPAAAQAKLLRVLQDGTFERVGGERTLRARARVVAATHRPLEEMVARGELREDLFYRLSVFPITIPPLRDRPEDLPALVEALVARAAARLARRGVPAVSADGLARLARHAWPGNVRELENVLERAAILARGGSIDERALVEAGLVTPSPAPPRRGRRGSKDGGAVQRLEDATRDALDRALRATGGRIYGIEGAAALLGLKPSTLQTKMIAHGLRRSDYGPGPV